MTALRAFGRSHEATLNDIFLAAYYRALIALFEPPAETPLTVQVSIDLRRYLAKGRAQAICNLSGGLFPAITRRSGEAFDQTLAAVTAAMGAIKADHPGVGTALFMENAFRQSFQQGLAAFSGMLAQYSTTGRWHPLLSNLGMLEWPRADGDRPAAQFFGEAEIADAFLVGPALYPPATMLAVSSFADALTFTMGYPDGAADPALVERFLDVFVGELPI